MAAIAVAGSSKSKPPMSISASAAKKQPSYIKRLYHDLKHLKEEPIVGANAEPLEEDMLIWYGIVLGAEGTRYAGIPIRFCLQFSDEYPNEPPKAFFETHIEYSGGAAYKDFMGRTIVCLNIFGNFGKIHTEWVTMSEGWSPSYTVHTILLSMQALFLSKMLARDQRTIAKTRQSALEFKCPTTGHNGPVRSSWFPKVITDYNIAKEVAANSGRVGYNVLRDFYICYVKKTSAIDKEPGTTLGYGIHVERNGTFSSPCEYLSQAAFSDGTRRGTTNKPFEFWFPILINQAYRGNFMERLNTALDTIVTANGRAFPRDWAPFKKVFKLCSSVMNNLVVEIMENAGNITANDKFINGYIAFYRLLISYASVDTRLIRYANKAIKNFISAPQNRVKRVVPNLGELLIHLTIADEYSWDDLAVLFMEECDTRNVYWYAFRNCWYPELANEHIVQGRAQKVFECTEISRNLVMYQVKFSKIVKQLTAETLEANFGLAPDDVRFELKDIFNMVQTIDTWDGFFDWVDMDRVPENVRDSQLVQALKRSANQGYHGSYTGNRCYVRSDTNLMDLIRNNLDKAVRDQDRGHKN